MMLVLVSVLLAVWAGPLSPQQRDASRTREIYVTVVDGSGSPVKGLTAADFIVREDNAQREVLKAGPADAPIHLAILVDDSQASAPAIQPLREGLPQFIDAMAGKAQMALITVGERPTIIVEYTDSAAQLKKGTMRLFARTGSGAYLLDGLVDASRGVAKREAKRPAMLAITMEAGPEFSTRHYDAVLGEIEKSGATLHVLAIGVPSASQADEMKNRAVVLSEGTTRTGGRFDQLLSENALPEKLKQTAHELNSQYVITYGRPDTLIPPERVTVSVKTPGLTVRARTRAGQR